MRGIAECDSPTATFGSAVEESHLKPFRQLINGRINDLVHDFVYLGKVVGLGHIVPSRCQPEIMTQETRGTVA